MRNAKNLTAIVALMMIISLDLVFPSGIALASILGDVVVDGESRSFGSDDVIHNMKVINGGTATLDGTQITGNLTIEGETTYVGFSSVSVGNDVTVRNGAQISMWYSTIGNNFTGDRSGHINFLISEVGGNLQINRGADFNAAFGPCRVGNDFRYKKSQAMYLNWFTIGNNLEVSDNQSSGYIRIMNSQIENNFKVCNNTMGQDITITDNMIGGCMEIKENTPAPTVSGNFTTLLVQYDFENIPINQSNDGIFDPAPPSFVDVDLVSASDLGIVAGSGQYMSLLDDYARDGVVPGQMMSFQQGIWAYYVVPPEDYHYFEFSVSADHNPVEISFISFLTGQNYHDSYSNPVPEVDGIIEYRSSSGAILGSDTFVVPFGLVGTPVRIVPSTDLVIDAEPLSFRIRFDEEIFGRHSYTTMLRVDDVELWNKPCSR